MALQIDDIPVLPRGVRLHRDRVRGGWVLLAPERTVALDQIGHAILSKVDGTASLSEIVRQLAAQFDAPPEQITGDVIEFLEGLRARIFLDLVRT